MGGGGEGLGVVQQRKFDVTARYTGRTENCSAEGHTEVHLLVSIRLPMQAMLLPGLMHIHGTSVVGSKPVHFNEAAIHAGIL